jgi:AraC-like DNA-binding protein
MAQFKEFAFKKFGHLVFEGGLAAHFSKEDLNSFVKIFFIRNGGKVTVDFETYDLEADAFFFVNAGQHFAVDDICCGTLLYYNRDFYCVEIHDKEVACDGILFHNVYETPVVHLDPVSSENLQGLLLQIQMEMETDDVNTEEMLRTLLKQIIIKCTRLWKREHRLDTEEAKPEVEFSRTFSQLVEWNYTRLHSVAEYASMLHITPKALNKRITRYSKTTPNDIIKERILLEAKRLLAHTDLSIKEIAHKLGYEDNSYFIRFFTKLATLAPQTFRRHYQKAIVK